MLLHVSGLHLGAHHSQGIRPFIFPIHRRRCLCEVLVSTTDDVCLAISIR